MNNKTTQIDEALEILKITYSNIRPPFSLDLLEECYRIERDTQYEHDREVPTDRLRKAVTIAVEKEFAETSKSDAL